MGMAITSWRPVTIAVGASLSGALAITGLRVLAIRQPASVEGTSFSFQASYDGGVTYDDLYATIEDAAVIATVEYQVPKSATLAQFILLPTTYAIYGPTHIKVRSGLTGAATVQVTTDATVWIGTEDVEAVSS